MILFEGCSLFVGPLKMNVDELDNEYVTCKQRNKMNEKEW